MAKIEDVIKLLDEGRIEEALETAEDVKKKKDMSLTLSDYAAGVMLNYSLPEISQRLLAKALKLDKDCASAHFNLGVLLSEPEMYEADPDNLSKAVKHYKKAVSLEPKNSEAHFNLGLIYAMTGQAEEARKCYEDYLRLEPKEHDKTDLLYGLIRSVEAT